MPVHSEAIDMLTDEEVSRCRKRGAKRRRAPDDHIPSTGARDSPCEEAALAHQSPTVDAAAASSDDVCDAAYTALVEKTESLRQRFSVRTQQPAVIPISAIRVMDPSLPVPTDAAAQSCPTARATEAPVLDMWSHPGEHMQAKRSAVLTELYELYTLLHIAMQ